MLTEKQTRFIDYFIETGNATEAARKAGYKKAHVQGAQNLEKLRAQIDDRLQALESERIASATEVMQYLTRVMRGESRAEIVVVEGTGDGCSAARRMEKAPDEKERLKAAEMIGKRYGLFSEKLAGADVEDLSPLAEMLK